MKHLYLLAFALLNITFGQAQCTVPTLSGVEGPTTAICSGESANLSATTDGEEIFWFDAANGGNVLANGSPFQTEALSSTTSFWAEAQNTEVGAPVSGGGKLSPSSTGGTTVTQVTSPWGLAFTATQDFILNSVDVFLSSSTAGNILLQLKDVNYNVIESVTVAAPAGGTNSAPVQFTVPLNLTIQGGESYKLVVVNGPAMIRDLSSNGFPYAIGNVGTITGGTINNANTNANVYYFLYNWNFSPLEVCSSERQEVVVTVINTAAPTGEQSQMYSEGETIADLEVTGENLSWYSDAAGTMPLSTDTVLTNGTTYYVQQIQNGCPGELLAITATQILATQDHSLQNLSYFPNPVTDKLTLQNSEPIDTVKIYNLKGQLVYDMDVENSTAQFDLSSIGTGVYFVKVHAANSSSVIRIVKR